MTTMLDLSPGWQVPVRQVGAAVPLATEQPAEEPAPTDPAPEPEPEPATTPSPAPDPTPSSQSDQEPEPAGMDNATVIPMRAQQNIDEDVEGDVEEDLADVDDHVDGVPARSQPDAVELDPPPAEPADPAPDGFSLRHASFVGYCMSVGIASVGQILALAQIFGGTLAAWVAAVVAAAFAEVTMIGAGSWSLELRRKRHPWKLLLVGAGAVCAYAVGLQVLHYLPQGWGTAAVFAGASAIGWSLHMAVEHVRVAAYIKDRDRYEAQLAEWRDRQRQQQDQQRPLQRTRSTSTATRSTSRSRGAKTKSPRKATGGKPQLTQEHVTELVRSGQLRSGQGVAELRKLTKDHYTLRAESTLKRWIDVARKTAASA